jgi:hypothetical protein
MISTRPKSEFSFHLVAKLKRFRVTKNFEARRNGNLIGVVFELNPKTPFKLQIQDRTLVIAC